MALHKLSEAKIKALVKPGVYGDGGGLWLRVYKGGSRAWVFIYIRAGKRAEIGLGGHGNGTAPVSLALARQKADGIRQQLANGEDPRAAKSAKPKTFLDCAKGLIEAKSPEWTGEHTAREWELHLLEYAIALHDKPVANIVVGDIKECLLPLWTTKPSTARRLLDRIKAAIDFGLAHQWRSAANPAVWAGLMDKVMTKPADSKAHHQAVEYDKIPAVVAKLREVNSSADRAVELLILTATRSAELREAPWEEIDLAKAIWTIPAERMKADRDHEIPLSDRAVAILRIQKDIAINDLVFPGQRQGRPLGEDSLISALRAASGNLKDTLHGLRSTFRDWTGDTTEVQREVAEAALSHSVGSAVEQAYRRKTALEKRRALMQSWSDYCGKPLPSS